MLVYSLESSNAKQVIERLTPSISAGKRLESKEECNWMLKCDVENWQSAEQGWKVLDKEKWQSAKWKWLFRILETFFYM